MTKSEPARSDQPSSLRSDTDQPCTASWTPLRHTNTQGEEWKLLSVAGWPTEYQHVETLKSRERYTYCMFRRCRVPEMKKPGGQLLPCGPRLYFGCQLFIWERSPKARYESLTANILMSDVPSEKVSSVGLTVEGVYIQQHGALPLVGGPLQPGGGVDSGSGSWELQRCQQFVLAQWAVLPWTLVRHIPAHQIMQTESSGFKCFSGKVSNKMANHSMAVFGLWQYMHLPPVFSTVI